MISVWLGDRSGWTGVRLVELDRSSFVDRSGGSWIGALVRGSELWFVGWSSGSWIGARSLWFVDRSWIGARSLWFVDRSAVRGSELSGSWIGLDRSSGSLGRSSFSILLCVAVRGSDLSGSWIGVDRRYEMWIGARSLFLSVLLCVDRSLLCCCVCVCFVFRFSLLSMLLCVESDLEMN